MMVDPTHGEITICVLRSGIDVLSTSSVSALINCLGETLAVIDRAGESELHRIGIAARSSLPERVELSSADTQSRRGLCVRHHLAFDIVHSNWMSEAVTAIAGTFEPKISIFRPEKVRYHRCPEQPCLDQSRLTRVWASVRRSPEFSVARQPAIPQSRSARSRPKGCSCRKGPNEKKSDAWVPPRENSPIVICL